MAPSSLLPTSAHLELRTRIRDLARAQRAAQDRLSRAHTAEIVLTEVLAMLECVRALAVRNGDGTLMAADRAALQDEADELVARIARTGALDGASSFPARVDLATVSLAAIDAAVADVARTRHGLRAVQHDLEQTMDALATHQRGLLASEPPTCVLQPAGE